MSWYKGYGRGWGEEKATGFARLAQIMREPAGSCTYVVLGATFIALWFLALIILPRFVA